MPTSFYQSRLGKTNTGQLVSLGADSWKRIYDEPHALYAFSVNEDSKRGDLTRVQYRNLVVSSHFLAIYAHYAKYKREMNIESRGSGFASEFAAGTLSAGAAIASERTANALAASVAAITGARAALAKEVYFDKTLPALIATMEGQQLKVAADILIGMGQSADEYSLPQALVDLARLDNASSLDTAVQQVTADANNRSQAAEVEFNFAAHACTPQGNISPLRASIRTGLYALADANETAMLEQAAASMNVKPIPGDLRATARAMNVAVVSAYCQVTDLQNLRTQLNTAAGKAFIQ